jgi:hypothetical protein
VKLAHVKRTRFLVAYRRCVFMSLWSSRSETNRVAGLVCMRSPPASMRSDLKAEQAHHALDVPTHLLCSVPRVMTSDGPRELAAE